MYPLIIRTLNQEIINKFQIKLRQEDFLRKGKTLKLLPDNILFYSPHFIL